MFGLDEMRARWKRARKFFKARRNDALYGLACLGVWVFQRLPLSLGVRFGAFLGLVAYYILPRERKRAQQHLAVAFGSEKSQEERTRIARRSFQNLGKNAVELVNFERLKKDLDRVVELEGEQYLKKALEQGRGVIWITGHLGNWELMACYMAYKGYRFRVLAREIDEERVNRLILGFREEAGVRVITRNSVSAGRQILQALKNGETLGMLIDQDTRVKGVMADFFGRKANTPAGAALLARRRSIPVIAGFIHRISNRGHRIVIHPPIALSITDDPSEDIVINTERFNKILEQHIRKDPEQWVWMHRRWKRGSAYEPARPGRAA